MRLLLGIVVSGLLLALGSCEEDFKVSLADMEGEYTYEINSGPPGDNNARTVGTGVVEVKIINENPVITLDKGTDRELVFPISSYTIGDNQNNIGFNFETFSTVDQTGIPVSIVGFRFYKVSEIEYHGVFWGEANILWLTYRSDYENDEFDFNNFFVANR